MRKTYEIAHYGESSISIFQEFFASIDETFILRGRKSTRMQFYEVLKLS